MQDLFSMQNEWDWKKYVPVANLRSSSTVACESYITLVIENRVFMHAFLSHVKWLRGWDEKAQFQHKNGHNWIKTQHEASVDISFNKAILTVYFIRGAVLVVLH